VRVYTNGRRTGRQWGGWTHPGSPVRLRGTGLVGGRRGLHRAESYNVHVVEKSTIVAAANTYAAIHAAELQLRDNLNLAIAKHEVLPGANARQGRDGGGCVAHHSSNVVHYVPQVKPLQTIVHYTTLQQMPAKKLPMSERRVIELVTRVTRDESDVINEAIEMDGSGPFAWIRTTLLARASRAVKRGKK
jgi:hypothetical protein